VDLARRKGALDERRADELREILGGAARGRPTGDG